MYLALDFIVLSNSLQHSWPCYIPRGVVPNNVSKLLIKNNTVYTVNFFLMWQDNLFLAPHEVIW